MEQNEMKQALLVMDMQVPIFGMMPALESVVQPTAKAIAHARSRKIPILYVVLGFRQGGPEISPNNKSFWAGKENFSSGKPEDFTKIHAALSPQPPDILITKRRISAFTGSDLEVVLRAQDIRHLVLSGIATSGVVLSTLREAADKDFKISVLADCCADRDEEVHRVLLTKVFPRHAEVLQAEEWIKL